MDTNFSGIRTGQITGSKSQVEGVAQKISALERAASDNSIDVARLISSGRSGINPMSNRAEIVQTRDDLIALGILGI